MNPTAAAKIIRLLLFVYLIAGLMLRKNGGEGGILTQALLLSYHPFSNKQKTAWILATSTFYFVSYSKR